MVTLKFKELRRMIFIGLCITAVYLIIPFIIFDMRSPAYAFDEEQNNGTQVAFGPKPWFLFARPSYHNFFYDGSEWPFFVFKPFCTAWLKLNNMLPASSIRP